MKNKKYISILFVILILGFLPIIISLNKKEDTLSKLETSGMISYTIDGNTATEKPTKGSGYVVKSITCKNGSNLVWDNDNWKVEIGTLENYENCKIDFTKDLTSTGRRVTLTTGSTETFTTTYSGPKKYEYNGTDGTDGSVQTFTAPATGEYTIEAWGGQGGEGYLASGNQAGGLGGYSKGTISLTKGELLYIYVGGKGQNGSSEAVTKTGGYNGGGNTSTKGKGGAGGGATHIATAEGLLNAMSSTANKAKILLVAAGGGGSAGYEGYVGGDGGGTTGEASTGYNTSYNAKGGTQSAGGAAGGYSNSKGSAGAFGKGGNTNTNTTYPYSGAGGAGYYGGGGGGYRSSSSYYYYGVSGGGGGSGFVATTLTNTSTTTQSEHTGNGQVIFTYTVNEDETVTPTEVEYVMDSTSKTTSNGEVEFYLKDNAKIYKVTGCDATVEENKIIVKNVTSNQTCTVTAKGPRIVEGSLASKMLEDNPTISERTSFASTLATDTTGTIYQTDKSENNTMIYYYAGKTTNNWVKFGQSHIYQGQRSSTNTSTKDYDSMEACTSASSYNYNCTEVKSDLYWRIIRTNEDGSVRLLYAGDSLTTTTPTLKAATYAFNSTSNDSMYEGYMYGTTGNLTNNRTNTNNSTMKTNIDAWYLNNFIDEYKTYINTDAIYCNDRTTGSGTYSTSSSFHNGGYVRLYTNKTPSYKCGTDEKNNLYSTADTADKFSVTKTYGNGKLTYPIGMMTADEVTFAGGIYGTAATPYYQVNSAGTTYSTAWWTITPAYFTGSYARNFLVIATGSMSYTRNSSTYGARPVISIKSCVKATGTGTSSDPYKLTIDSTCANQTN